MNARTLIENELAPRLSPLRDVLQEIVDGGFFKDTDPEFEASLERVLARGRPREMRSILQAVSDGGFFKDTDPEFEARLAEVLAGP